MEFCIICRASHLSEVIPPQDLGGISSDIKPFARNFPLLICQQCGHVQKRLDEEWQRAVNDIYRDYVIYQLADGAEQVVFEGDVSQARSARLLSRLREIANLAEIGSLLDVGCGNGAMLRSFSNLRPAWYLYGQDTNKNFRAAVEAIPGVQRFYDNLDLIQEHFDLITLLHVLEHVPQPASFLQTHSQRLKPGGLLLIQVPDFLDNPFDLLVVDHSSHFMPETLTYLAEEVGYACVSPAEAWIPKEVSLLLRRGDETSSAVSTGNVHGAVQQRIDWLVTVRDHARKMAVGQFGIFGTATGGTWLASQLGDSVGFFVDEDPAKTGKVHLEKMILLPQDASAESSVYIALPHIVAGEIFERLQSTYPHIRFILPPDL